MKSILLFFSIFICSLVIGQEVTIGTQVWMTKNLNLDKFRNGELIPQANTHAEWEQAKENKQPAWCYYDNDPKNGTKYGKLYNWYAVNDSRWLAPAGWHVPTDAEWTTLGKLLGRSDSGKKMKSTSGWNSYTTGGSKTCSNCNDWNAVYRRKTACHVCKDSRSVPARTVTLSGNGTNTSGFSGLPGGTRDNDGTFGNVGESGSWWGSVENFTLNAWLRYLDYYPGYVTRYGFNKQKGLSVRCLRD